MIDPLIVLLFDGPILLVGWGGLALVGFDTMSAELNILDCLSLFDITTNVYITISILKFN